MPRLRRLSIEHWRGVYEGTSWQGRFKTSEDLYVDGKRSIARE
jgi:hypothetical protein